MIVSQRVTEINSIERSNNYTRLAFNARQPAKLQKQNKAKNYKTTTTNKQTNKQTNKKPTKTTTTLV